MHPLGPLMISPTMPEPGPGRNIISEDRLCRIATATVNQLVNTDSEKFSDQDVYQQCSHEWSR